MKRIRFFEFLKNRMGSICRDPVIVLGNQKSGTTAMAGLLAMGVAHRATLDIPPMWEPELSRLLQNKRRLDRFVFRNKGNAAVSWEAFFGPNLERITKICGSRMSRLSYSY